MGSAKYDPTALPLQPVFETKVSYHRNERFSLPAFMDPTTTAQPKRSTIEKDYVHILLKEDLEIVWRLKETNDSKGKKARALVPLTQIIMLVLS